MAISSPFMWGSKGRKMTPEALERERAIIDGIKGRVGDTSPVGHWLQGAGRVVDAITGQIRDRRADASEQLGLDSADDFIANNPVLSSLVGGQAGGGYEMLMPELNVPPVGGPSGGGNRDTFIQQMMPHAMRVSEQTGLDPRVIIAQAAQETGWGRSAPGNNYFGIKSHGKAGGNTLATNEVINGQTVRINDSFRGFSDMGDSVDGYAEFLQKNPRYKDMLSAPDLEGQIAALGRSGYATDPNYANSVGSIAQSIQLPDGYTPSAGGGSPMGNSFTGGGTQMADNSGVVSALSNAMSDPWVAKKYGPAIQAMLGQQMRRGDMEYQAQLQQQDPMYQAKLHALQNPAEGAGAGVRSSQILADGTLVQSTDAGPRVFGPTGDQLTGQEAADAIKAANAYDVENQQQIYGGRRSGTLGADIDLGGAAASSVEGGKIAAEAGKASFEAYQTVMGNLSNINEAVAAIDSGAKSGIAQRYLPNISVSSATLENAMNRMGLDVIGSVTFGALSEAEMRLAMDTAVPRDLSPPELREWLVAKGEAQQKAAEALYQAGLYLSKPGNTLETWMAENPPEFVPFGQPQTDPNPQPQSAPAQGGEPMASQPGNFPDFGAMSDEELDAFLARTGGGQ